MQNFILLQVYNTFFTVRFLINRESYFLLVHYYFVSMGCSLRNLVLSELELDSLVLVRNIVMLILQNKYYYYWNSIYKIPGAWPSVLPPPGTALGFRKPCRNSPKSLAYDEPRPAYLTTIWILIPMKMLRVLLRKFKKLEVGVLIVISWKFLKSCRKNNQPIVRESELYKNPDDTLNSDIDNAW